MQTWFDDRRIVQDDRLLLTLELQTMLGPVDSDSLMEDA